MRLALSTLGLPGQTLDDAIAIAARGGCQGLELRLHPDTGVHTGLGPDQRRAVRARIAAAGLEIAALASYVKITAPGPDGPVVAELAGALRLAADLGAPAVRVFPGGTDTGAAVRRLHAAGLEDQDALVLVETHDALPTGADVAGLLDAVALPGRVRALWDVLHPWRHGEQPRETIRALGGHLAYFQVKDARSATDTTPVPLGSGTVPLAEAGEVLVAVGYDGWASLEWERTWYPHVEPAELVLPGAEDWVRRFSGAR